MLRRGVAFALVVTTAFAVGCDSGETPGDETKPSAPTARTFGIRQVQRAFREHGLPLVELRTFAPEPDGRRTFAYQEGGPIFQVEIHRSIEPAKAAENAYYFLTPNNYRLRGPVLTQRKANVVVTYENGRTAIRSRFRAALADLR